MSQAMIMKPNSQESSPLKTVEECFVANGTNKSGGGKTLRKDIRRCRY